MKTPNRMISVLLTAGVVTASVSGARAAPPETEPLAALAWMGGHWCQQREDVHIEEYWLPSRGGMLIGMGRTVRGAQASGFEFLRIELRDGRITLVAQPNGEPPVAFLLTASGAGWARFENPAHDFPKRVEYRRAGGGLHAEIGGPGEDGKERVVPFDYVSCGS